MHPFAFALLALAAPPTAPATTPTPPPAATLTVDAKDALRAIADPSQRDFAEGERLGDAFVARGRSGLLVAADVVLQPRGRDDRLVRGARLTLQSLHQDADFAFLADVKLPPELPRRRAPPASRDARMAIAETKGDGSVLEAADPSFCALADLMFLVGQGVQLDETRPSGAPAMKRVPALERFVLRIVDKLYPTCVQGTDEHAYVHPQATALYMLDQMYGWRTSDDNVASPSGQGWFVDGPDEVARFKSWRRAHPIK